MFRLKLFLIALGISASVHTSGPDQVELTLDGINVAGTSTRPIRFDPTGTTPQPITGTVTASGTVTANQGTAGVSAWPISLPTTADGTSSHPFSSAQSGAWAVTSSGTATVTQGAAGVSAWPISLPTTADGTSSHPFSSAQSGAWTVTSSGTATVTQGAAGASAWPISLPATANGTQSFPLVVSGQLSSTSAVTGVAQNAASVSVLAVNASRHGGQLANGSTANAYCILKAGAASIASAGYTVRMAANGYYEIPSDYTGEIRCIWDAAGSGFMNVTEITP